MRARPVAVAVLVAALALATACKPDNGYAVDVTVRAKGLPTDVTAAVVALVENVAGAEQWQQRYPIDGLRGDAAFIYRPRVTGGTLTIAIDALDGSGEVLAHGAADVTLAPGKTVFLDITLDVVTPPSPPPDLAVPLDLGVPPDLPVPLDLGALPDLDRGDAGVVVDTVCHDACARLIACGVHETQAQCESGCGPLWHDCAAAAAGDCNAIALCNFRQFAAIWCGGLAGGYPQGTTSCAITSACEGACNISSPTAQCTCACTKQLDPSRALDSVVHATCAGALCPQCAPGDMFNGAACNACAKNECNDHCMSN
jgi:hypothetical protein